MIFNFYSKKNKKLAARIITIIVASLLVLAMIVPALSYLVD